MKELTDGQKTETQISIGGTSVVGTSVLDVITRLALDPKVGIDVVERLLAMQLTIMEEQRKQAFAGAMNRLQAKLPQITKAGTIFNKARTNSQGVIQAPTVRSHYELIEDIDAVIRPLYTEEGFSLSFNEEESTGNMRKFSMTLLHSDGHSKTLYKTMPFDANDYRTAAQSEASTTSLARRQLLKMHFNLVGRGEDDDGQGGPEPITEEQARDLHAMIDEIAASLGVEAPRVARGFLKVMGVARVEDILDRDYRKAVSALEEKRRAQR